MNMLMTNINPKTGIAYGLISSNALHPDVVDALMYGSQAKGVDHASSDVDLMIVSENLLHSDAYAALTKAEQMLARPINPTIVSFAEWQRRREDRNHFLENVATHPKLFVLGSEDDLA